MIVNEIKLYELLKAKIGEKEAEAFVQILENGVEKKLAEKTSVFATKEDVRKLETKIIETKAELIKWMFIFWMGQLAAFIGIAEFILK